MAVAALNERLSANDYIRNPGERARKQWTAGQGQIRQIINSADSLEEPEEKVLVAKITNDLDSTDQIFEQIILLNPGDSKIVLNEERESQLMEELTLKIQELSLFSSELAEFNNQEAEVFLEDIVILFSLITAVFFIFLIGSFRIIWNGVKRLDEAKAVAQKEQERLNTLMQSIGDGVFAIDRSWKITLWNKAASELTGWKPEEAIGKPFREVIKFISKDTSKENIVFIEEAMLYGQVRMMENHTWLIRRGGQEIPVGDSAAPILGPDGQATGCIIVFRDVSKEFEVEKVKEDFTFRIVHDLRSPLTVMNSILSIEDIKPILNSKPELQDRFDLLVEAVKQMMGMVNDLLSSVKSKKNGSLTKKIAITDIIGSIVRSLGPVATSRSVTCKYTPPADLPLVSASNPDHIKEVFTNLFNNAIKYNKDGGSITISHEVSGDFLRTEIEDTGIGISPENLAHIFSPYTRFDEKEGVQGTGLGLYIVKNLIEEAKGKIEVSSKLEKGTTFSVYLPIK